MFTDTDDNYDDDDNVSDDSDDSDDDNSDDGRDDDDDHHDDTDNLLSAGLMDIEDGLRGILSSGLLFSAEEEALRVD